VWPAEGIPAGDPRCLSRPGRLASGSVGARGRGGLPGGARRASIRAALAVVSLGMAYLFLAMLLDMIHMGGMMPGM
jgi:hypothetical protein